MIKFIEKSQDIFLFKIYQTIFFSVPIGTKLNNQPRGTTTMTVPNKIRFYYCCVLVSAPFSRCYRKYSFEESIVMFGYLLSIFIKPTFIDIIFIFSPGVCFTHRTPIQTFNPYLLKIEFLKVLCLFLPTYSILLQGIPCTKFNSSRPPAPSSQ